eukprot:1256251-Amphidinium_carterae.2
MLGYSHAIRLLHGQIQSMGQAPSASKASGIADAKSVSASKIADSEKAFAAPGAWGTNGRPIPAPPPVAPAAVSCVPPNSIKAPGAVAGGINAPGASVHTPRSSTGSENLNPLAKK